jgi:hypothetical protein
MSMLVIHRRRITGSRRFEMRSVTRYNGMRLSPVVPSLPTTNGRPHGRSTEGALGQMADLAVLLSRRFLPAYDRVLAAGYPLGRVHESSQETSRRSHRFRRPCLSFDLTEIVVLLGYHTIFIYILGLCTNSSPCRSGP